LTQARLNADKFAAVLEEFLSGPCTAQTLADSAGMSYRYTMRLVRTMHKRGVIHISAWEKDSIGRVAVRVYALGHGTNARKPAKPREKVNRDYRTKQQRDPLKGTPFYGLTVATNDTSRTGRKAA
jgi:hypothetical protein